MLYENKKKHKKSLKHHILFSKIRIIDENVSLFSLIILILSILNNEIL